MSRRLLLALAAAGLGLGLSAVPAAAAPLPGPGVSAPTASAPALKLSVKPQADRPDRLVLTSRLDFIAIPKGAAVDFFVVSTEFGEAREVPIGHADVDRNGSASVVYSPTWNGQEKFVVHLAGDTQVVAATASYNVSASAHGPYYALANQARPFGPLGQTFVEVLLATVALVWLTLILTLWRVARGLPRAA